MMRIVLLFTLLNYVQSNPLETPHLPAAIPVPFSTDTIIAMDGNGNPLPKGMVFLSPDLEFGPLGTKEYKEMWDGDPDITHSGLATLCTHEDENGWCRTVKINNIGHVCPCCVPLYGEWDVTPKPLHDNDAVQRYFFKPAPNTIFTNTHKIFIGRDSNIEDGWVTFRQKLLFVTGNECKRGNKTGVSILLPEKEFNEEKAKQYQTFLNDWVLLGAEN